MAHDAVNGFPLLLSRPDSVLQLYPAPFPHESAFTNGDQNGSNLNQSNSNLNQNGSNLDQNGSNLDQNGSNLDQNGSNPDQTGSNPDQTGSNLNQTGSNLDQPGTNLNQRGLLLSWERDHPTASQRPVERLTTLPMEITGIITENLSRRDLVALSLTCFRLRRMIYGPRERKISDVLTLTEFLVFLHQCSRNDGNAWVCMECRTIHSVNPYDTPGSPEEVNCRIALYGGYRVGPNGEVRMIEPWLAKTGLHLMAFHLGYHHLQYMFKYRRLPHITKSQMGHFKRLIAPHRRSDVFLPRRGETDNTSKHEVHLRFIGNELLAMSVWTQRLKSGFMVVEDMEGLYICPHLHLAVLPGYIRTAARPSSLLQQYLAEALATPGMSQTGSCWDCPIDYSIFCADKKSAEVRAWYRLGGECVGGSDRYWRALSVDLRQGAPNLSVFSTSHSPGTVREFYEFCTTHLMGQLIEDVIGFDRTS